MAGPVRPARIRDMGMVGPMVGRPGGGGVNDTLKRVVDTLDHDRGRGGAPGGFDGAIWTGSDSGTSEATVVLPTGTFVGAASAFFIVDFGSGSWPWVAGITHFLPREPGEYLDMDYVSEGTASGATPALVWVGDGGAVTAGIVPIVGTPFASSSVSLKVRAVKLG